MSKGEKMAYEKVAYNNQYNKETYKTVKVYIREEEYPDIIKHMESKGYQKVSGYIKDLIKKDMEQEAEQSREKPRGGYCE